MARQESLELDYQTIRRRIVNRLIKRFLFVVNALIWLITGWTHLIPVDQKSPVVWAAWFLVLVVQFFFAFDIWSGLVERFTRREVERLQRLGYHIAPAEGAKLKRQQGARLSDDGEIVYEDQPARQAARSRHDGEGGRA